MPPLLKTAAPVACSPDEPPPDLSQPQLVSSSSGDSCCTAAALLPADSLPVTASNASYAAAAVAVSSCRDDAVSDGRGATAAGVATAVTAAATDVGTAPTGSEAAGHGVDGDAAPVGSKEATDAGAVAGADSAPEQQIGAAAAGSMLTDESVAKWVQLPQHRAKGRAAHGQASAEEPWQVGLS